MDADRIFNVDETGFLLGDCVGRVVAAKGSKKVHKVCFMMLVSHIYTLVFQFTKFLKQELFGFRRPFFSVYEAP